MKAVLVALLALALGLTPACKKKTEEAGTSGRAAPIAPPVPPPPPPPATKPTKDGGGARVTAQQTADWAAKVVRPLLEKEAKSRPTGTPKAEQVLDALAKAGVKFKGRNQALASIVGAKYCVGADTEDLLGLMVCEYESEEAAQKGRKSSQMLFGQAISGRVELNKKTTLSVSFLAKTPETAARTNNIFQVFAKQ